jgi:hypothetical protein
MQADMGADNPALISPLRTRVSGVAQPARAAVIASAAVNMGSFIILFR